MLNCEFLPLRLLKSKTELCFMHNFKCACSFEKNDREMWMLCILLIHPTFVALSQVPTIGPAKFKNVYIESEPVQNIVQEDSNSAFDFSNIPQLYLAVQTLKDGPCKRDLGRYVRAISQQEKWAMSMFDASVKFPNGLLHGQMYQLGNFDECVNVQHEGIEGQYCLVNVFMENNTFINIKKNNGQRTRNTIDNTVHWAFCLPKSCSEDQTQIVLQTLFQKILNLEGAVISDLNCSYNQSTPFSVLEIVYGSALGIFVLLILLSTGYHGVHVYKKTHCSEYSLDRSRKGYSLSHEVILAFSLMRNVGKIIEIKAKNNDFNLDSISGLKAISMIIILSGHALIFLVTSPTINSNFLDKEIVKPQNAIFLNNPLLVDSFLLISGFLMCRLLMLELEKRNGKVNLFILYMARYIRLTPAYLTVVGFYATFFIRIGDGPLWNGRISTERDCCLNSWWTNILYINNYVMTDSFCMFQSWYLSVDTQLFITAPFIVYPLWRKRIIGQWLLGILIFSTAFVPFIYTYIYKLDPTLMVYLSEIRDLTHNPYFINAYIKTHMRANAYILGLFFGYLVHRTQASGYKLTNYTRIIGWTFSSICGLAALFSITYFYSPVYEYNILHSAIYSSLHRICWCILIGWTIFVTVVHNDGFVNKFLSWKFWGPFSRLAYCAYLVNGIIELYSFGTQRVPKYMSVFNLATETISHVFLTFTAAFILCLLFESPIHNLEKILLKRGTSNEQNSFHANK